MTEESTQPQTEPTAAPTESPAPAEASEQSLDQLWANRNEPVNEPQTAPQEQLTAETPNAEEPVAEPSEEIQTNESDEPDLFAEFESPKLPDADELKELLKRSPDASKTRLTQVIENARANEGVIEKIGGEKAVPVFESLSKSLFTPEVTTESTDSFLNEVFSVNPHLVATATVQMVNAVFGEQSWQPFLEEKIQERFGYDSERINQLVHLSQSGILESEDIKFLLEDEDLRGQYGLNGNAPNNPYVQKLEQRIAEYERTDANRKNSETEQSNRQAEYLRQVSEKSDEYVNEKVADSIAPILEKIGWTRSEKDPENWGDAKDAFGDMRQAWLEKQIKSSPEAKNIEYLVKTGQAFTPNGQPMPAYVMQVEKLEGKAKANIVRAAKILQPTFAKSLSMTRNAAKPIQPTVQPTQPPPAQQPPSLPQRFQSKAESDKELDDLWNSAKAGQAQTLQMQGQMRQGR